MKIAFVMDDMSIHSNGTSATAKRYAESLREQGHEVRCVAFGASGPDGYPVPEHQIPVIENFSARRDFHFAKPVPSVFDKAFDGVDVIHIFLPFELGREALKWGRKHKVPVTAAFHLQPQNETYSAGLGSDPLLSDEIFHLFKKWLYEDVRHIHCPSNMIASQLREHGYKAILHVISNGVPNAFSPDEGKVFDDDLFHIITVGRLSAEKDQETIIRAVEESKYSEKIQLHICGEGPLLHKLQEMGKKLTHRPIIEYLSQEDLIDLERSCPIYIHASLVDIEAISVIEALACGCVPIIAKSKLSAPSEFALCDQSLFKAQSYKQLAERIDWWIDNPDQIVQWRNRYIEEGYDDRLSACTERFVGMLEMAIADDRVDYETEAGIAKWLKSETAAL